MAESSISVAQDQLSCSICLDLLKDAVALTCGHSYCMSCITGYWNQKGVYSCPQCRQTFTPRPVLGKNTMLAEVVEKIKKTKLQAARPAQCFAGSGDVECDVCTGDKNKAVWCVWNLTQHKMTDANGQLQEMICPQHDKLLEIFCCTDQHCLCYMCMVDEYKDHDTVSALTLDPNTVNKNLVLSEENRVIEYTREEQLYPDHPDRFDGFPQVLCRESVCGRCYWEVEWSGWVGISVSYKRISRKGWGKECEFGCNDQSWCLYYSDSSCSFWHNNGRTALPVVSSSSRIGVYVDHGAGTLSFYSVSDTMTLIHKVHTTFTQPLYAGFWANKYLKRLMFFFSKVSKVDLTI
uniref:Tripartite motif-containing protein 16-like n=1 Tax=Sinocyclocheilus rhinocerous TaxID=307959 RepID=A0A673MHX9_9TELE